ncbi:uncharacterized protein LOC109523599 [Hippocampus comes]|uniref:uncharacterized protein LOC109523599 n=1 Tax=Hippocampus comes TaxID=109280 RepID=UPI00094E8AD6|nr:PREDICTED: CENPB DNA-binding domain-containing protein 1 [Hippocampus comes]
MPPKVKVEPSGGHTSKKRKAITMDVKLDVVKRSKRGETPTNIGRALHLSRSTVVTIIKAQDRILEHVKASPHMKSTITSRQKSGLLEAKKFTCKSLAAGFLLIEEGLAKFKAEDADAARYARVYKGVMDNLRCYNEIWEEVKSVSFQSNLKQLLKMLERPAPDPPLDPVQDPEISTSTA